MAPYIFGVFVYPAAQLCGFAVAMILLAWLSRSAGPSRWRILTAFALLGLGAIAGAALDAPSFRPSMGLRYPGAGIGVLAALPLARFTLAGTTSMAAFGDLTAIPLAVGLAIAKTCCFFHGCCFGLRSELPWAITFPYRSQAWFHHLKTGLIAPAAERSLAVHPSQLYFVAWSIFVGALLFAMRRRPRYDGQLFLLLLFLHGIGWFVLESFKVDANPQLKVVMAVLALVSGVVLIARMAHTRVRRLRLA